VIGSSTCSERSRLTISPNRSTAIRSTKEATVRIQRKGCGGGCGEDEEGLVMVKAIALVK